MVILSPSLSSTKDLGFLWLQSGGACPDVESAALLDRARADDPDIAFVDALRKRADPLPAYAVELDDHFIQSSLTPCHVLWPDHLHHLLALIGSERPPLLSSSPRLDVCGTLTPARAEWTRDVLSRLDDYLAGVLSLLRDPIHTALGRPDPDKLGAVQLLRSALELGVSVPVDAFDDAYARVQPGSHLAEKLKPAFAALRFRCGYRWELTVLDLCHAIGDARFRRQLDLSGPCDHQLMSVHRDDPVRLEYASGILVGLWSFLADVPQTQVVSRYPLLARPARRVRYTLGDETPGKRWIAGRTFVALRLWLGKVDAAAQSALLSPIPTLAGET